MKPKTPKCYCVKCKKEYSIKGIYTHYERAHGTNEEQLKYIRKDGYTSEKIIAYRKKQSIDAEVRNKENRRQYYKAPKYCIKCNILIDYDHRANKFCCHSCAAIYSNKNRAPVKTGPLKYTKVRQCVKCYKSEKPEPVCLTQKELDRKFILNNPPYTQIKICVSCGTYTDNIHGKYCKICSPNVRHYRSRAKFKFNVFDYPDEFKLQLIKDFGWYSPNGYKKRNKTVNLSGVSRDHLYSIAEGYINNKDPELLAHPANCEIMIHNGAGGNNSKHSKSSITWTELLKRITKWNKKYNWSLL